MCARGGASAITCVRSFSFSACRKAEHRRCVYFLLFLVTSAELKIQTGLNLDEEDGESQLGLDATPAYLRYASVPPPVVSTIKMEGSRFIITVRDPGHRGYSWYSHILQGLIGRPRFDQACQVFDTGQLGGQVHAKVDRRVRPTLDEVPEARFPTLLAPH
mmetsp:Transcript_5447/g.23152  ORF Transcript_5447/g.23152 Transcript_5447/m.23152 type:complete len:160 (-) Transcript_5447:769-1248(-)